MNPFIQRLRLSTRSWVSVLVVLSPAVFAAQHGEAGWAWPFEAWLQHRARVLQQQGLIRYYTFENLGPDTAQIPNAAGAEGALAHRRSTNRLVLVPGRWPQKPAVRLDADYLAGAPFELTNGPLSVTAWVRVVGQGSIRGDSVPTGGTLLSWGGGYWDGWRLTYRYPDRTLSLEIGRPKPASAVQVSTRPVADGVWHHLAAVWDGQQMRLHLNGVLAASAPFAGPLTLPAPGSQFRIGLAGYGWGSVVLDVDEVAVYGTDLSPAAILADALLHTAIPSAVAQRFDAAEQALAWRYLSAATAEYATALRLPERTGSWTPLLQLQLGEALLQQRNYPEAAQQLCAALAQGQLTQGARQMALTGLRQVVSQAPETLPPQAYAALLESGELGAREQVEVSLRLARALRQTGDLVAAQQRYQQVLGLTNATLRERLEARLGLGNLAFEMGNHAAARAEYQQIVDVTDAPAHFRSYAALRIAQSFAAQTNYAAAEAAYARVEAAADYPAHHRTEARECRQELARLAAGQPARDPAATRLQLPSRPTPGLELFVSPNGAPGNPGTTDRPLASLEQARDRIRALKRKGGLPPGGVTVTVRSGDYRLTNTFRLEAQDSGTASAPIVYRAERKGAVRLHGGLQVRGFTAVTNPSVLARLPAEAQRRVLVADLKAQGVTNFGQMRQRGFGYSPSPILELFFNGQAMPVARWPNEGFVRTGKIIDSGSATARRGPVFEYQGDRPARWTQANQAWLLGYWRYLWAEATLGLAGVDVQNRRLIAAHPYSYGGGIQADMPYYVFNLLEEIDMPGEWFLDRDTGQLYFWPPRDPTRAVIEVSMLEGPLVQLSGVAEVTFEGLVLELGRSSGVVISGGSNCLLVACTVRKLGGDAVLIEGGTHHGLLGCDLYELGRGGARISGGDRATLSPGRHFMENCHVHHFSRVDRTYTPAVWLDGVGHRIAHNAFHHSPGHALRIEGNEHLIEFNDVHHVVLETDDQGGLDMHYNPTYRGNIIRYNFWHEIGSGNVPCGQAGVRLDDAICGVLIYGNIFYRCSHGLFGAVQIHGGKENILDNNLFVDCQYAVSFSPWGANRWRSFLAEAGRNQRVITNALYLARYPALAHLADNADVNSLWRNLVVNCGSVMTRDRGQQDLLDNWVVQADPGFVNPARGNFALRPNSRVWAQIGFRPIPVAEIGPYSSPHRATWPLR